MSGDSVIVLADKKKWMTSTDDFEEAFVKFATSSEYCCAAGCIYKRNVFSSDMLGAGFDLICNILTFLNCLKIIKGVLNANYENLLLPIVVVGIITSFFVDTVHVMFFEGNPPDLAGKTEC